MSTAPNGEIRKKPVQPGPYHNHHTINYFGPPCGKRPVCNLPDAEQQTAVRLRRGGISSTIIRHNLDIVSSSSLPLVQDPQAYHP
ncbi:hypothetical protein OOU_Y34scaffold00793g20 [Pyricularia oryzae Y34]|uniref:Uncharacterized protein n=2 Tax=Pyricularia oryzae TaxID=318829 RepID=A0AA97NPT6_PYRO3|nr:hypothetical protein OOU_Y34scaffold00793g20 [Pyricularia oryzae Y34]